MPRKNHEYKNFTKFTDKYPWKIEDEMTQKLLESERKSINTSQKTGGKDFFFLDFC